MKVGRPVFSADGRVLLAKGVELRDSLINRLSALGVLAVYIDDGSGIEVEDVVRDETRRMAVAVMRDVMETAREEAISARDRKIAVIGDARIRSTVSELVDDLLTNRQAVVNLTDIRIMDQYTFSHSVNVCVLSVMTGITLGYDAARLRDLGLGALLHDIGKTQVRVNLVKGSHHYSEDEFEEMKKHTVYGFEMLRRQKELNLLCAHIAYQHHERYNGEGYPRGLKGDEIHEYARIVSVADVYDALTTERPHRPAFLPHQAIELILGAGNSLFELRIAEAFVTHIALYPVGSEVELTTGEAGLVTFVPRGFTSRPRVRITHAADGTPVTGFREIDLMQEPSVLVRRVIDRDDRGNRIRGTSLRALDYERG